MEAVSELSEYDYSMMVFDCETTGFMRRNNPAYIIQLSWIILDSDFKTIKEENYYIKPPIPIPKSATKKNRITDEIVDKLGSPPREVLMKFHSDRKHSKTIIAHNYSFDSEFIDFETMRIGLNEEDPIENKPHICTMERTRTFCAFPKKKKPKLEELAVCCGIEVPKDLHNAIVDCRITLQCFSFLIKNNYISYTYDIKPTSKKKRAANGEKIDKYDKNKLEPDLFKQNLSGADENHPFYDRRVVITGDFSKARKTYARQIKDTGAKIDYNVSRNTNFLIVGENPGYRKIENINKWIESGYTIRVLNEDDLKKILAEEYEGYFVDKETYKDLKISVELVDNNMMTLEDAPFNAFSGKQCYMGKGFKGNKYRFYQLFGNLGANTDEKLDINIDGNKNWYILSDRTYTNLIDEIKDETIKDIENYYNKNRSINFYLKFILESQFLEYYKKRMETMDDDVVIGCYDKYIESTKPGYQSALVEDDDFYFKPDSNSATKDGITALKTEDGRIWVPSRQMRK